MRIKTTKFDGVRYAELSLDGQLILIDEGEEILCDIGSVLSQLGKVNAEAMMRRIRINELNARIEELENELE